MRGQASVEFALIVAIIVALGLTSLVIGGVFIEYLKIDAIAREAARVGVEAGKKDGTAGIAVANARRWANIVYNDLQPKCIRWSTSISYSGGYNRGGMFSVIVTCDYRLPYDPAGVISQLASFSGVPSTSSLGSGGVIRLTARHYFRIQKHKARFP
ncbi:MAG: TadE/TadG family type IV pilus assembly protein [Chloroflexota bacterium]